MNPAVKWTFWIVIPIFVASLIAVPQLMENSAAAARLSREIQSQQTETRNTRSRSGRSAAGRDTVPATLGDWNQFRGPERDNLNRESGFADSWPAEGPQLLLKIEGIGEGYSSVAVSGDLICTMGNLDGAEYVIALDRQSGQIRWKTRNGNEYREGQGNGPRGTPTVVDGRVYSLGGHGDLSCLDATDGTLIWKMNILQEFGGSNIIWGISESVLVDDGRVICTPGGRDATVVALDAATGSVVWKSPVPEQPQASYASPVIATTGRVKQYVIFTSKGICGIRASNGEPLWGQNASSNGTANCATPLVFGNYVFSSSDYGTGAELVELQVRGNGVQAKPVYFTKDMKNHHGGMVLVDGYVYGSNSDILACIDVKTGKPTWRERSLKGSVIYTDGKIIFRHEGGPVVLLAADPSSFRELGRFDQPERSDRPAWSHPVVADGRLYLRDQNTLLVYQLRPQ